MNITPIGITSNNDKTAFNGKLIKVNDKKWIDGVFEAILTTESPSLDRLLNGHDIYLRQRSKTVRKPDGRHYEGQRVYQIVASIVRENSIMGKIADSLHLVPRHKVTQNYHLDYNLPACMDEFHFSRVYKNFYNIK